VLTLGVQWWVHQSSSRLLAEFDGVVVSQQGKIFLYGEKDSPRLQILVRGVRGYFGKEEPVLLQTLELGKLMRGERFEVLRASEHFLRARFDDRTILFLSEIPDTEKQALISSRIRMDSDWWILERSFVPDFLPMPKKGVLLLGTTKPNKALTEFATENNLPLIYLKEVGGAMLQDDAVFVR